MCTYSMVADHYRDKLQPDWGWLGQLGPQQWVSKEDFEALKRDVAEMKKLLERAAEYDRRNNEPECEMEDKIAFLRKVAEFVGIPDAVKEH